MTEWLTKNTIIPQFDWFAPHSFASAVPSTPAAWRRSPLIQVLVQMFLLWIFLWLYCPNSRRSHLGFEWQALSGFLLWLMLQEYSVFSLEGQQSGDWTTFYFSLCLQSLAPGLEHCDASKSVCGCTSSQEECRQCVYSPQIVMCADLLLTTATSSLFRNLPSTPWPEGWDSHPGWHPVESPHCHGGRPFLHFRPLYMPPFPMEMHFSLSWALEVSHELGEGTGPYSWQGWGGTPQFHRVKCCW